MIDFAFQPGCTGDVGANIGLPHEPGDESFGDGVLTADSCSVSATKCRCKLGLGGTDRSKSAFEKIAYSLCYSFGVTRVDFATSQDFIFQAEEPFVHQ